MKNDLKIERKKLSILDTFESDAEGGNDEDLGKTSPGEKYKSQLPFILEQKVVDCYSCIVKQSICGEISILPRCSSTCPLLRPLCLL